MSVETVNVDVSDKEIFAGVLGNDPIEQEPVRETAPEPVKRDDGRDEQGRFAPKVEAKPEPAVETQQPAVTEKPDTDAQVPSWRLREIREERETIAKQLEQERGHRARLEREMQQFRAQQPQTPPPDIFQDPNAWQSHLTNQFQSQIEGLRFGQSEFLARDKFGDEKVDAAFRWAEQNIGPAERARMQNARSPYHELVKMYDERQTLSQIGGDLSAYRTKVMDEALNDPAFMQKVADKLRGIQPAGSAPPVRLPPSLNRATGAGNQGDGLTDGDVSSQELFKHAFSK
jgi:hypothetical protein